MIPRSDENKDNLSIEENQLANMEKRRFKKFYGTHEIHYKTLSRQRQTDRPKYKHS